MVSTMAESLNTKSLYAGEGGGSRESPGSLYLRTTLLTVLLAAARRPVEEKLGFSFSLGGAEPSFEIERASIGGGE